MKKIAELLLVGLLLIALVACGKSEENKPEEPQNNEPEPTETVSEPADPRDLSDEELIAKAKEELVGEWYCAIVDIESLIFNDDGTGHYTGLDKNYDFTYSIGVRRLERANNGRLVEDLMTINYDSGDTEDLVFLIGDEEITGYPGETKMIFQTLENGGYSGVMNFFDPWIKK